MNLILCIRHHDKKDFFRTKLRNKAICEIWDAFHTADEMLELMLNAAHSV